MYTIRNNDFKIIHVVRVIVVINSTDNITTIRVISENKGINQMLCRAF